jgi:NitT/TauT family transport system permease protein
MPANSAPPRVIAAGRRPGSALDRVVTDNRAVVAAAVADLERRAHRRRVAVQAARLGAAVALLAAWQGVAMLIGDAFAYPAPAQVWHRLVEWFTLGTSYGSIWSQIATTLEEAAAGFATGALAGTVAGVLLARTRFVADICAPFLSAADAVPRIVLGSLFVILFGLGMSSKIATVVVMVFFAVFYDAFSAVREIDPAMLQQADVLGASRWSALTTIVVPVARPRVLAGLHRAFGLALIGALMGEYIGSHRGLGLLIHNAQAMFDVAGVYAGLLLTTMIALAADTVLRLLQVLATR